MGRLILGIVAGFILTSVIAVACDYIIRAIAPGAFPDGGHPAMPWLLVAIVYSVLAAVAGGYLTAAVVPDRAQLAGIVLGVLMILAGIAAAISRPGTAPVWYHAVSLMLVIPAVLAGVALRTGRPAALDG
jgi:hypothetical protein